MDGQMGQIDRQEMGKVGRRGHAEGISARHSQEGKRPGGQEARRAGGRAYLDLVDGELVLLQRDLDRQAHGG